MDQGMAAVIAGTVGAIGALSGAIAGMRGARLGAVKAVEAAQIQVQGQFEAEHRYWLREQRRQAFMQTSHQYVEVLHCLRAWETSLRRSDADTASARRESAERAVTDLAIVVFDLRLWGPHEIVQIGKRLRRAAQRALETAVQWQEAVEYDQGTQTSIETFTDAMNHLGDPYSDFMEAAADALSRSPHA